jgi:hypothetical protein
VRVRSLAGVTIAVGVGVVGVPAGRAWAAPETHPESPPEVAKREPFVTHEPYFTSGFGYYASDRRVVAGLGGGPGYRLNVGRHFSAYAEGRWLVYTGSAFTGAVGGMYRLRIIEGWEPIIGVQVVGYAGNRIEVISSAAPQPAPSTAWAAQVRLGLLRFVHEPFTVSALCLDWGYGADAGTRATAISVSLIDIGFRL